MTIQNPNFEAIPGDLLREVPSHAQSLCCNVPSPRVNACTEDGDIGIAEFGPDVGIDLMHDGPAAYQCSGCGRMMYLAI